MDKKALRFRGGTLGALAPFALFLAGVGWLGLAGAPDERGFWPVLLAALVLGLLLVEDRAEWSEALLRGMSQPVVALMIVAWLFAGCLGALLSASGLVESLVWLARVAGVAGSAYVAAAYLIACALSTATGTSLGTLLLCGPLLYPAGAALGANPAFLMGGILAGATFGDSLSPISDTTIASAMTQGADIPGVVRARLKYALPSAGAALVSLPVPGRRLGVRGRRRGVRRWLAPGPPHGPGPHPRGVPPPAPAPSRGIAPSRDPGHGGVEPGVRPPPARAAPLHRRGTLLRARPAPGWPRARGRRVHLHPAPHGPRLHPPSHGPCRPARGAHSRFGTQPPRAPNGSSFRSCRRPCSSPPTASWPSSPRGRSRAKPAKRLGLTAYRRANLLDLTACTWPFLLPYFIPTILAASATAAGEPLGLPRLSPFTVGLHNAYSGALVVMVVFAVVTGFGRQEAAVS